MTTPATQTIRLRGWEPCDLKANAYLAWGQLAKLAAPILEFHHTDLAHDLDILRGYAERAAQAGVTEVFFYWSVDRWGTCLYEMDAFGEALRLARTREHVYGCRYFWHDTGHGDGEYMLALTEVPNRK